MDAPTFFSLFAGQIAGYLVGGIPFGYLLTRWKTGQDVRGMGSGNIGATNVGRVLGFQYFLVVFALDFLKGAGPVLAAAALRANSESTAFDFLPEVVGFAAILGHVFPVYLGMKGGKGVATTIGVLVCLVPEETAAGLAAWIALLLTTRMVSVASIGFALTLSAGYFAFHANALSRTNAALSGLVAVVSLLVMARHAGNLRRIAAGTEPRVNLPWSKEATKSDVSEAGS
jgi:glycerol-3-phosphate acyltransferase PlsY